MRRTASNCALRPEIAAQARPQVRHRIQGAIGLIAQDPLPPGARTLQGREGLRVPVGDYRISYTIDAQVVIVVVVKIGHRRDVYGL